jgi:hypothetical protein
MLKIPQRRSINAVSAEDAAECSCRMLVIIARPAMRYRARLRLGSSITEIDETFANFRDQFREIGWLLPFDVSLHDFIYFTMQALGFALWHTPSPFKIHESPRRLLPADRATG